MLGLAPQHQVQGVWILLLDNLISSSDKVWFKEIAAVQGHSLRTDVLF